VTLVPGATCPRECSGGKHILFLQGFFRMPQENEIKVWSGFALQQVYLAMHCPLLSTMHILDIYGSWR
jgi:hypothetical protein